MSQNCPNCGTLNSAAHRFCSNCGTRLSSPEDTTSAAPSGATDSSTAAMLPFNSPGQTQEPVTFAVQRWDSDAASEPPPIASPQPPQPAPKAYQLYTPGASARREGFTYAPYG